MAEDKFLIRLGADVSSLQGDLSKANNHLTNFSNKIGSLAGFTIAGAAIGAIAGKMMDMVHAGAESIDGENKLLFALKGRVDVQERLISQATALHGTTLFEDDEIIKQQALLAAMGRSEGQIKKIINAAVDLSAATGTDLVGAVAALNKSLGGVGKGLVAIDPQFKGLTETQLKNGEAIDIVAKKYAGFGEALTETGSGPMKQFSKQVDDLGENLGKALLPGVNLLTGYLNDMVTYWTASGEEIERADIGFFDGAKERAEKLRALRTKMAEEGGGIHNFVPAKHKKWLASLVGITTESVGEIKQRIQDLTSDINEVTNNNEYRKIKLKIEVEQSKLDTLLSEITSGQLLRKNYKLPDIGVISEIKTPEIASTLPDKMGAIGLPKMTEDIKEMNIQLSQLASQGLSEVAEGFGRAMVTGEGFGQTILKAITGFMKSLGQQLIAIGIGKMALDKLFKGPGGGIAAIAAGVALVAGAAAINASASKSISSLGSGGGSQGSSYSTTGRASAGNAQDTMKVEVTGVLTGQGTSLLATIQQTEQANRSRRG